MGTDDPPARARRGLAVDARGFAASERAAAYEITNTILTMNLRLQTALAMRPEELQVFLVIVLATVQRYTRSPEPDPAFLTNIPLPASLAGFTSRRRIADVLGIPLETVRRHVIRLIERGLVVERARGKLCTPGGTLAQLGEVDVPAAIASDLVALSNVLLRQGAFTLAPPDRKSVEAARSGEPGRNRSRRPHEGGT